MGLLDRITISLGDIRDVVADVVILKYADGLYGADKAMAETCGFEGPLSRGEIGWVPGHDIAFIGVGPLFEFRYRDIRAFAHDMLLHVQRDRPQVRTIATTIHGPGYGLDEREAFSAQIEGYRDAMNAGIAGIDRIIIVEHNDARVARLTSMIHDWTSDTSGKSDDLKVVLKPLVAVPGVDASWRMALASPSGDDADARAVKGLPDTGKSRLFVAMPFAEEHQDAYDIAFMDAAHDNGFICERLDFESYVGDVTAEIARRIKAAGGVIALLNSDNPNVYYEVGYAMALDKPIIFVAHADQKIPFDLRNQRRLTYRRIAELRDALRKLIADLKKDGVLD